MNLEKRSLERWGQFKETRVAGAITNLDDTLIAKDLQQTNPRSEDISVDMAESTTRKSI